MKNLIDRQAAIKAIENLQDCYNGFSDTFDKACIIGLIEEQPTVEIQGWISVKERLPEEEHEVLVYEATYRNVFTASLSDGEWEDFSANPNRCYLTGGMYANITHWMPVPAFPEPYREESEDD